MASWLVPFFPCWVNIEATLLDPFKNILPGALRSWSFPCFLRELLLLCVLTLGDVGEQGRGLLPSADKQDPILRALIMLSIHSRTTTQLEHQFPVDWAVSNRSRTPLSLSSRLPITPNPVTSVQKLLNPNELHNPGIWWNQFHCDTQNRIFSNFLCLLHQQSTKRNTIQ